jgi:hypothetical protein
MVHGSLSPEGRIQTGLHSIDCSQRQFADIAADMGVPVSSALISLCLSGKRAFTAWTAERLIDLLSELLALRDYFKDVPIHWGSFERVSTLIVTRRVELAAAYVDAAAKVVPNPNK